MRQQILVLHNKDNVGTAVEDISIGVTLNYTVGERNGSVVAINQIPFGFKIALIDIMKGQDIIKYGEVIGSASCSIKAGELVHTQNVQGGRGRGDIPASEGMRVIRNTTSEGKTC